MDSGFLWWVWIIGGCLIGALWAELFLTRPVPGTRSASLSPRLLGDYLPGRLRWSLRSAGLAALLVGIAGWAPPDVGGLALSSGEVSSGASLGLGIAGAVLALAVEALQRHIIGRPQPVVASDVLAADDAIRAGSVHTLAGAGLGIELLVVAVAVVRVIEAHPHLPLGLSGFPYVLVIAGLSAWRYYSHRAWRVQRPVSTAAAPVGQ